MFEGFSIIFISIILEALPFVVIGAIASSLIEIYVSPEGIRKRIPKNKLIGFLLVASIGVIFPVCECAIVPIVRRLIKKGMPISLAVTFMLAIPIVNPIVLASTYYAFPADISIPILRGVMGYIGAIIIGVTMDKLSEKDVMKDNLCNTRHIGDHSGCTCCGEKEHIHTDISKSLKNRIKHIIAHTSSELYDVGRFLIIGALISAVLQTFVSREFLVRLSSNDLTSILFMMALAFVLSLCSEADAFIASTFRSQFSTGAIIGFLIFGPMIDIKNTLMLSSSFKTKFIIRLICTIGIVCCLLALFVNMI